MLKYTRYTPVWFLLISPENGCFFEATYDFQDSIFSALVLSIFWINENSRSEILFHEYLIDYSICLSPTVYHPSATSLYNLERLQGPTVTISPKSKIWDLYFSKTGYFERRVPSFRPKWRLDSVYLSILSISIMYFMQKTCLWCPFDDQLFIPMPLLFQNIDIFSDKTDFWNDFYIKMAANRNVSQYK